MNKKNKIFCLFKAQEACNFAFVGLLVVFLLSFSVEAQPHNIQNRERRKNLLGKIDFSLEGQSYSEGLDRFRGIIFSLDTEFNYTISPMLELQFDGEFQWVSANVQLRSRPDHSNDRLKVSQVFIKVEPYKAFVFKVGSINYQSLEAPLLISKRSFPGILEKFRYSFGPKKAYKFSLTAQQSIPTSASFNQERSGLEDIPFFAVEKLMLKTKSLEALDLEASLIHYLYKDLPAVVAARSRKFGNTIEGSLNNSSFTTPFNGFSLMGKACLCRFSKDFNVTLSHQIFNNKKILSNGKGQHTKLEFRTQVGSIELSGIYENYFKDRDVVPAIYSDLRYGGNNRKGQAYHISINFINEGFRLVGGHYNNKVISARSPHQQDSKITYIAVESHIAKF